MTKSTIVPEVATDSPAPSEGEVRGFDLGQPDRRESARPEKAADHMAVSSPARSRKRWLHVLKLGTVAAPVLLLTNGIVQSLLEWLRSSAPKLHPWFPAVLLITLALAAAFRVRIPRIFRVRNSISYPPAWVAVAPGLGVLSVLSLLWPQAFSEGLWAVDTASPELPAVLAGLCCAVSVLVVLALLADARLRRNTSHIPQLSAPSSPSTTNRSLRRTDLEWLRHDVPIVSPEADRFGLFPIAQRIARRVIEHPGNNASVAVLGEVGSGKSSLGRLTEYLIQRNTTSAETRFVRVSLWPYESSSAAIRACIDALVGEIRKQVGPTELDRLADEYLTAIEGINAPVGKMARLIDTTHSPADAIGRIDEIGCAIGMRIVLWVEDLERLGSNQDRRSSSEDGAAQVDLVRSLLYLLDQQRSVYVVIATTSAMLLNDAAKSARYIELIRRPEPALVASLVAGFRRLHLDAMKKEGIIDPETSRAALDDLDNFEMIANVRQVLANRRLQVVESLVQFCRTPRVIKAALRACDERWAVLKGEINFDDLLVLSIVAHAQPRTYLAIADRIEILRHPVPVSLSSGSASTERVQATIDDVASSVAQDDREAMIALLKFLFPALDQTPRAPAIKVQGLARDDTSDYWARYNSAGVLEDCRDQAVFGIFRYGDDEAVLKALVAPETKKRAAYLAQELSFSRGVRLLRLALVDLLALVPPHPELSSRFFPVYSVLVVRFKKGDWLESELYDALRVTMSEAFSADHLSLVAAVDHVFNTDEASMPMMLSPEHRIELRILLVEGLCRYAGDINQLAGALRNLSYDYTLLHLVWGLDTLRAERANGLPFPGWTTFSRALLSAGKIAPDAVIPKIAPFVTRQASMPAGPKLEYAADKAGQLFDEHELLALFKNVPASARTDAVQAVSAAVQHSEVRNR